ncbi:cell division transport system permease protein [Lachnospiraceae bacterium XBB1006]|nr:cell division transport system permease protein [Lachnospiraceae bacterium XBB1006]
MISIRVRKMRKLGTLRYTTKQGIINIGKNKMFSLASIATMAACIFLFGIFYSMIMNFQNMVKVAEEGVAVTVFFDKGVKDKQIKAIGKKIEERPEVSKVVYVSADEAWEEYKKIYFNGKEEMADGWKENPLVNSSNYQIYLSDVSMQSTLVSYLQDLDGVKRVNKSDLVANALSDFNRLIGFVSAAIILILLMVAVFLISNTITVGIGVRREEIEIMKLIGATDYFVRAPFIVEGILIGLIGSGLPLIILYLMYGKIIGYIIERFVFLNNVLKFLPVHTVFQTLVPVALLLGVGIGFIGSRMTIRKHLSV